jgi:glycosidase
VPDLWLALRDVVLFWAKEGVKLFRVDNPHTKPLPFWEWMIAEVRARDPDARLPLRSLHAPQGDVPAGQGRLLAVLHLLHLAQQQGEMTST